MEHFKSLAQFVSEQREKLGITQQALAKKSGLDLNTILDIEAAKDLFLSSTVRQKLAKGLKLNPSDIIQYERTMNIGYNYNEETENKIRQAILNNTSETLLCPVCSAPLQTRIVKMYDLEDNLVLHPKANCTKCPFQIK